MYFSYVYLRKLPSVINVPSASAKWVTSSVLFSIGHCSSFGNSLALKSWICACSTGLQMRTACAGPVEEGRASSSH